jgi:hypothetical protein
MAKERVSAILKTEDVSRTIDWFRQVGFKIREVSPTPPSPRGARCPATA